MNKKDDVWAKTMLIAYRYLAPISKAIDKVFNKTVKASFNMSGMYGDRYSAENISNRLIKMTNKKVDYINLKVIIENALSKLKPQCSKLLILRYIKELNVTTICNLLNICERTLFRRLNKALAQFRECVKEIGYTTEKLEVVYLNDSFIKSIYDLTKNNNTSALRSEDLIDGQFYKYIYNLSVCGA